MFQVWLGKRVEIKVSYRIKLRFYFQVASGLPAEGSENYPLSILAAGMQG